MRRQFSSGFVFIALLAAPVYAQPQVKIIEPEDRSPGIVKIARGTTECREPSRDDALCATEYWTMYVHADGTRYMHVVSDNMRFGQARHAMLWVDPGGDTREAYLNTWTTDGVIGSAYAVKREDSVDVAASDLGFERAGEGNDPGRSESSRPAGFHRRRPRLGRRTAFPPLRLRRTGQAASRHLLDGRHPARHDGRRNRPLAVHISRRRGDHPRRRQDLHGGQVRDGQRAPKCG